MSDPMSDAMKDQPTMDALRRLLPVVGPQRRGLYAGPAGTGPEGKTCRSCTHKTYTGNGPKFYPKCGLTHYTHGDATTIRTSTPACHHYQETTR